MSAYHNIYQQNFEEVKTDIENRLVKNQFTVWSSFYSAMQSAFNWNHRPKDCRVHQPEEFLTYWRSMGHFVENGEHKLLPCFPNGELLENGLYSRYTFIAKNGKQYIRPIEDCEICFGNSMEMPAIILLNEMSEKAGFALSAVDAQLRKAIMPDIYECSTEEMMNKISGLTNEIDNLKPIRAIFSNNGIGDGIKKTSTYDSKEKSVQELWDIYIRYKNSFLTLYGVFNIETQKSERLTEQESKGQEDIVRYSMISDMYTCRKDFVDRVKEHFDFDYNLVCNRSIDITKEEVKRSKELILTDGRSEENGGFAGNEHNE